jgi:hypothetical protein
MTAEEEAEVYAQSYDHTRWDEHRVRVQETIQFVAGLSIGHGWESGIDLSCGDGAIMLGLKRAGVVRTAYLGDRAWAHHLDVIGELEHTIPLSTAPSRIQYDVMVMSETIEHLRDPDCVLRLAHDLADWLVVTTPVGETTERHGNPEHYWSWDVSDVKEMLITAGWNPVEHKLLDLPYYTYQLWGCHR